MEVDLRLWARAVIASATRCIRSALTERSTLIQGITLPINYLILLALFALAGSNAPTAVVLEEHGPYARHFVQAMQDAQSFHVLIESPTEARQEMQAGRLVALVTIPATFDAAVAAGEPIALPVEINNLNEDLTDDARRGMGLAVTLFYQHAFPAKVPMTVQEQDSFQTDTGYIPFLAISIMVIALLVSGLLQAGMNAAREWERGTVTVWKLAPAPDGAVQLGLMLGSLVMTLPSVLVVLTVVVMVSGWPAHPALVLLTALLALLCFVAAGSALGMAVKERGTLTLFARAVAVPAFFLSGVFGPISFSTPAVMWTARLLPVHYATVLAQASFKNFVMNTLPLSANAAILGGFTLLFVGLSLLALRVGRVAHA
jgi:ABC-2 type transport system permease protein